MNKSIYKIALVLAITVMASCSDSVDVPELPSKPSIDIPAGVELDAQKLFGVWGAQQSSGNTASTYFEQRYEISFQSVEDGEAVISHWYVDGTTEIPDSIMNLEYSYTFDGRKVSLTPNSSALLKGAVPITAVHTGSDNMILYTQNGIYADSICTLNRIGDPLPSISYVDRTLPVAGQKVTVKGRNLQFVNQIFLPSANGDEIEIVDFEKGSKEISFILPEGNYGPGSLRARSESAHVSCFSPAYMFCTPCVFFHDFDEKGTSAPYTGTEFEYTINWGWGAIKSNVSICSSDNIPEGHSLYGKDIINPGRMLNMFGNLPKVWNVAENTNTFGGYLRFSGGDRFQWAVDNSNGIITPRTKCMDLAIQMDIYVVCDGEPEWSTGYLSYRINKNEFGLGSSMAANVAMWDMYTPCRFDDGWKTFTIPMSEFPVVTATTTISDLIGTLKKSNHQTILTIVNYPLSELHPTKNLESFQFCIADIRLVPYSTPAAKKE